MWRDMTCAYYSVKSAVSLLTNAPSRRILIIRDGEVADTKGESEAPRPRKKGMDKSPASDTHPPETAARNGRAKLWRPSRRSTELSTGSAPPAIAQVVAALAMIALGVPGTYLISAILTRVFGRDFS